MRGPHKGRVPAAMLKRLDALREAVEALPPGQQTAAADPIFGGGPRPAASAIPADLPPALAAAFGRLQAALDGPPPSLGWPIVNTPLLQAQLDAQKTKQAGRPTTVQPNQVVRLVRFVKLGRTVAEAADKAGLTRFTAYRILKGDHPVARHPAVLAAGVELPNPVRSPSVAKPVQNPGMPPVRPEEALAATPVAKTRPEASIGRVSEMVGPEGIAEVQA